MGKPLKQIARIFLLILRLNVIKGSHIFCTSNQVLMLPNDFGILVGKKKLHARALDTCEAPRVRSRKARR